MASRPQELAAIAVGLVLYFTGAVILHVPIPQFGRRFSAASYCPFRGPEPGNEVIRQHPSLTEANAPCSYSSDNCCYP
jgi:hypothetical protein